MKVKELINIAGSRAEEIAKELFPAGKKVSGQWHIGGLDGSPGSSMGISLDPTKGLAWVDSATQERGGALDLVLKAKGLKSRGEAHEWLGRRLGVKVQLAQPKVYRIPKPDLKPVSPDGLVMRYLTGERKLPVDTCKAFRVAGAMRVFDGKPVACVAYPRFAAEGELVNCQYVGLERVDGKKVVQQEGGCAPTCFGWQAVDKLLDWICITEGEVDAMTLHAMGLNAVSVPNGTANLNWIEHDWLNLELFTTIYLCFDNDEPGKKALEVVGRRLRYGRCRVVRFGDWKDANDALVKGGWTSMQFKQSVIEADFLDLQQVAAARTFGINFDAEEETDRDAFCPELLGGNVEFGRGEYTVWQGLGGSGKTTLVQQLLSEAARSSRVLLCCFETRVTGRKGTMAKMCHQWCGSRDYTVEDKGEWLARYGDRLVFVNHMGPVSEQDLLEWWDYAFERYGVRHIMLDSFMLVRIGSDDYEAQKGFCQRLVEFAQTRALHIHLIAHSRKIEHGAKIGQSDVKGTNEIVNLASNVLAMKRVEEKAKPEDPDCIMRINKNRELGILGKVELYYSQERKRFFRTRDDPPTGRDADADDVAQVPMKGSEPEVNETLSVADAASDATEGTSDGASN